MRALAVTILLSAGLARADVAGNQPVKTNPGITLSVQGVPGGIPIPISTGGGTGGTGGGLTPVQGVDGGYPVKVDQGAAAWRVDGSGVTQPVSAASLPLPTGAATDRSTAAAPNSCRLSDGAAFYKGTTPTDTQPVSGTFWQSTQPVSIAATVNTSDAHTTAVAPLACRLTDGAAFYTGPLGTQLPAALDGSGFLKTHEQGTASVSGTVTAVQGTGTNLHVVVDSAPSTAVTGTVTATQATGSNLHVQVDTAPTTAVTSAIQDPAFIAPGATGAPSKAVVVMGKSADGTPVYSPVPLATGSGSVVVSGTVTANAGSNLNTSALALDATLTGRTQKAQITDGTRDGTVKAGSTAAAAADTSVVVALHPSSPLPAGSNVIGHVITDTNSTTAVTGNVTVVQGTGTNLHTVLDTTSTTAVTQATGTNLHAVLDTTSTTAVTQATGTNLHTVVDSAPTTAVTQSGVWTVEPGNTANTTAWKVDGSAVTQPVSTADTAPVNQALGALNAACTLTMAGQASAGFQLAAGTLVGTIIPEVSHDNGATYNATFFDDSVTGNKVASIVFGSSNTATDRTIVGAGGMDHVRVRVSAFTSGTAGCLIRGSASNDPSVLFSGAAGAPVPTVAQVGGKDGSGNVQPLTMKAGSTAAAAADISAVVALHPSSPLPAGSNVIGALSANQSVNVAQVGGNSEANGGANGSLAVGGTAATNAAITQNPLLVGAEAQSGTPAAATTGNQRQVVANLDGVLFSIAGGPNRWSCGLNGQAASLAQCQAAPAAGTFLYVDSVYVQGVTTTAGTYAISCGTGTNCGTTNVALFPVSGTGNRWTAPTSAQTLQTIAFNPPLKCPTAAQELCVIGTATNTVSVQVEGHTGH